MRYDSVSTGCPSRWTLTFGNDQQHQPAIHSNKKRIHNQLFFYFSYRNNAISLQIPIFVTELHSDHYAITLS